MDPLPNWYIQSSSKELFPLFVPGCGGFVWTAIMAEKLMPRAMEDLEQQLTCLICLDMYTNPKLLQCNHVYCQKCLVKLVVRDQRGALAVTCPSCRQVTPVPASGTQGLQSAFRINHLLDIFTELTKSSTLESKEDTKDTKDTWYCPVHHKRELELYCEDCSRLVCFT